MAHNINIGLKAKIALVGLNRAHRQLSPLHGTVGNKANDGIKYHSENTMFTQQASWHLDFSFAFCTKQSQKAVCMLSTSNQSCADEKNIL